MKARANQSRLETGLLSCFQVDHRFQEFPRIAKTGYEREKQLVAGVDSTHSDSEKHWSVRAPFPTHTTTMHHRLYDAATATSQCSSNKGSLRNKTMSEPTAHSSSTFHGSDNESSENWSSKDLLFLFVGLHEKSRALSNSWEYLTIRDLVHLSLLSRTVRKNLERIEYTRCRDGHDYLVPYPGFPGLLSTPSDVDGSGLFRHQLASLEAMHRAENTQKEFGCLRGGILGDAPGLGKTITMLGLIASTAGIRPVNPPEFWSEDDLQNGWNNLRSNVAARQSLLHALKPIRRWMENCVIKKSHEYKSYKELERYIQPPYNDDRFRTIRDFELYVKKSLKRFVPQSTLELFRVNVMNLKVTLDKTNRSLIKSEKGKRLLIERNLLSTNATVIIVPDALLEHWFQQIIKHLNLKRFSENNDDNDSPVPRSVVYLDGIGDIADARLPLGHVSHLDAQIHSPWYLSKYLIVVTTFSRCGKAYRDEVKAGRMEKVSNATTKSTGRGQKQRNNKRKRNDNSTVVQHHGLSLSPTSPLLQMRWLRLVVDEGHELGTHEAGSDVTWFINKVRIRFLVFSSSVSINMASYRSSTEAFLWKFSNLK